MQTSPANNQHQTNLRKGFSFRRMTLQARITLLVLLISIPLLLISNLVISYRTEVAFRSFANEQLEQTSTALLLKTDLWLQMNGNLLNQLVNLPQIRSMEPQQQALILTETSKAFPRIFLAHALALDGMDVARSDGKKLTSYADRAWFQKAASGVPLNYEVVISRTINKPVLTITSPIKNDFGGVSGVLSLTSELNDISRAVLGAEQSGGASGVESFIVDGAGMIIAHPDKAISEALENEKRNFSAYPPVASLLGGKTGLQPFTDAQGRRWLAYVTRMENGWGIVAQQPEEIALARVESYRQMAWVVTLLAAVLLLGGTIWLVGRSLRPIHELTGAVAAITAGDLTREVKLGGDDEVGALANAFKAMTDQVRGNILTLEERVQNRTRALTLSSEVSRRVSTILDQEKLVQEVVNELQKSFDYYHVQVYLFDDTLQNLVMVSGTGDPGRVMLTNNHRVPAGRGLVGRAAGLNEAVLVPDTAADPDWLANPLLPDTKSELAVPISIGSNVLGVLDVQQNAQNGLTEADQELMQLIANQVAIGVQNARAYSQVQTSADRQAVVARISQQIQRASSIDDVLKVAVRELGQALGAQQSAVELRQAGLFDESRNN